MTMTLKPVNEATVVCRDRDGHDVAHLRLTPANDQSPLAVIDARQARRTGEAEVQLCENGRYWCEVIAARTSRSPDLHVACSLVRSRSPNRSLVVIETGPHVGLLRIAGVRADGDEVGAGYVEVRSVKLSYREDYRAMLRDLDARMMRLLYDARSSSQVRLRTTWRDEPRALQQRLAFLHETLASSAFRAAVRNVVEAPHRRLRPEPVTRPINKSFKPDRSVMRQMAGGGARVGLQQTHALAARMRALGIGRPSVPARVDIRAGSDDLDTPENQFVKFALTSFQDFLARAAKVLRRHGADWETAARRAERDAQELSQWLAHSFFKALSPSRLAPLGSPALQRKAGYRDVLRAWLRFDAHAHVAWDGLDDVFHAGKRDAARLYEYWLFFQLLDWFCQRFDGARQDAKRWVQALDDGVVLTLKHGQTAGPFAGVHDGRGTRLKAQFSYNRTFAATGKATAAGSWTQTMRPDFTFTLWPAALDLDEAERQARAVHLHLDAKYRVEHVRDVLAGDGGASSASDTTRDDLLKMHAYRDAIRRTAGAYVLYPGNDAARAAQWQPGEGRGVRANVLFASDELLPSLGAFAIIPVESGHAKGMDQLAVFLDAVVEHLTLSGFRPL